MKSKMMMAMVVLVMMLAAWIGCDGSFLNWDKFPQNDMTRALCPTGQQVFACPVKSGHGQKVLGFLDECSCSPCMAEFCGPDEEDVRFRVATALQVDAKTFHCDPVGLDGKTIKLKLPDVIDQWSVDNRCVPEDEEQPCARLLEACGNPFSESDLPSCCDTQQVVPGKPPSALGCALLDPNDEQGKCVIDTYDPCLASAQCDPEDTCKAQDSTGTSGICCGYLGAPCDPDNFVDPPWTGLGGCCPGFQCVASRCQ